MSRDFNERLGARIRQRRQELDLSQDDVGRKMGLKATGNYLSRWERGANRPSDDYLELLAKALETTVADLMAGPDGGSDTPDAMAALRKGDIRAQLLEVSRKLDALLAAMKLRPDDVEEFARAFEEGEVRAPGRVSRSAKRAPGSLANGSG